MEIVSPKITEMSDEELLERQLSYRPLTEEEIRANMLSNIVGGMATESMVEVYFVSRP